ncbi:DUF4230 domain-containing protein [Chryseomicrobium sp. FSL W7-1435]|uniref:DUF4230 domain-containing protein n=1 Tax=Chryseomicrobium sp. FSL W7-1435 TaxID=2921704 RepID=UPI00315A22CB
MTNNKRMKELEKELEQLKREEAATYVESPGRARSVGKPFKLTKWIPLLIGIVVILLAINFVRTFEFGSLIGSVSSESKSAFVERLQENEELVTAEGYLKTVIQKEDFKTLPFDLKIPGTTRQILIIFPGQVQAGIDLSAISEQDIELDEETKTARFTIPKPVILGEPTLFMDRVQVFSNTGLLAEGLDAAESFEIAAEAQELMKEEAASSGLLALAETNAEKVLQDMFQLVEYDVTIEFEE